MIICDWHNELKPREIVKARFTATVSTGYTRAACEEHGPELLKRVSDRFVSPYVALHPAAQS